MSNIKGLPAVIVIPFAPTVVFSTTQGTVTYTTQLGTIRYMGAEYSPANPDINAWTVLLSVSLIFTFVGSVGNVSVGGIPLTLPTGSGTARSAPLSISTGITLPANAEGRPSSQLTYPSTSPISANIIYYTNTGTIANVNNTNLGGTVTIGITQLLSSTTPPY